MTVRDDQNVILDSLLCEWHQWAQQSGHVRGFNSRALVMGDYYRTSRQYDDVNGALDSDRDAERMETVDKQVWMMPDPHRSAIHANARALVVGCEVFMHPRLPPDRAARIVIITEARAQLSRRLVSAGVL